MSNPTTPFSWQMPTSTDLVTDLPADFEVFGQAVATSMADLLGGTTGQILSKTSNTDMDFTWIANDQGDITAVTATSPLTGGGTSGAITVGIQAGSTTQSGAVQLTDSTSSTSTTTAATPNSVKTSYDLANAAIAKSTVTTAGDIIYRNATVPTRLGIGTAGQVLAVNSGATAPEWVTAGSGAVTQIADTTLASAAADITFSSIPSTYNHLMLVISGFGTSAAANGAKLFMQFNGASGGTDYSHSRNVKYGTAGATVTIEGAFSDSRIDLGYVWCGTAVTNATGAATINIMNYKGTTLFKRATFFGGSSTDAPGAGAGAGVWKSTSAVTSVKITTDATNLGIGTRATLYGMV